MSYLLISYLMVIFLSFIRICVFFYILFTPVFDIDLFWVVLFVYFHCLHFTMLPYYSQSHFHRILSLFSVIHRFSFHLLMSLLGKKSGLFQLLTYQYLPKIAVFWGSSNLFGMIFLKRTFHSIGYLMHSSRFWLAPLQQVVSTRTDLLQSAPGRIQNIFKLIFFLLNKDKKILIHLIFYLSRNSIAWFVL